MRFGCTKQLNLLVVLGWVQIFPLVMGCVSQLLGWVGSGHTKGTHGQLWGGVHELMNGNYREDSRRQTSSRHYDIVICTDRIGIGQST